MRLRKKDFHMKYMGKIRFSGKSKINDCYDVP